MPTVSAAKVRRIRSSLARSAASEARRAVMSTNVNTTPPMRSSAVR